MEYVVIVVIFVAFALAIGWAWHKEIANWNNGTCVHCGGEYKSFDVDSMGGIGYKCDSCGNVIWITYPMGM